MSQQSEVLALKSLSVKQRRNKELSILKMLTHHPNIVELVYFYFSGKTDELQLHLFFEKVDSVCYYCYWDFKRHFGKPLASF